MYSRIIDRLINNVESVVIINREVLELALVSIICEGHILIEDVPGIGKTTLAKALAKSLGCSFRRIQCTPDLLPSDIMGINFFNQKTGEFEFRPGPVMSNIVLVDEINRATPRTQSSLLECMQERQVTIDGITTFLPRPFLVIATQNPVELQGTFSLPEAQLDRFLIRLSLGYPDFQSEESMVLRFEKSNPLDVLSPVTSAEELLDVIQAVQRVYVEATVRHYILEIIRKTRNNASITLGASPRASLALYRASQALALVRGRDFVIPDDVKQLARPVLSHRLILNTKAHLHNINKEDLIAEILETVAVPAD